MADKNWSSEADGDARDAIEYFLDEIVSAAFDNRDEVPTAIDEWSDSYHHETHVDRSYRLMEAAEILDQLSQYEETDSGLWEGQEPQEAVITQAAFTYAHAVYSEFRTMMEGVNEGLSDVFSEMAEEETKREERKDELEADRADADEVHLPKIDAELATLEDDKAFEKRWKRRIKRVVEEAAGIKPKRPTGPKEWEP
jgi:hypothetical protein